MSSFETPSAAASRSRCTGPGVKLPLAMAVTSFASNSVIMASWLALIPAFSMYQAKGFITADILSLH